jgi:hypothetical protein
MKHKLNYEESESMIKKVIAVILSIIVLAVVVGSDKMDWLPIWGKVVISVLWLFVCMWIIGGATNED